MSFSNMVTPVHRSTCQTDAVMRCGLCGDVAWEAIAIVVDEAKQTAVVEIGQTTETVALDLLEDVTVGDALLIHQGFAIARVER